MSIKDHCRSLPSGVAERDTRELFVVERMCWMIPLSVAVMVCVLM